MPPSRLRSASRLCGGMRPWGRATTEAGTLTVPSCAKGLTWRACGAQCCYLVTSCGAPVTDDEKPKRTKSWREIDKMRDRSGGAGLAGCFARARGPRQHADPTHKLTAQRA